MAERRDDLIAARVAAGHTQESLAEAIDVYPKSIRNWEHGNSTPTRDNQLRLAPALNRTHQELRLMLGLTPPAQVAPPEAPEFEALAMFPTLDAPPAEFLARTTVATPVPKRIGHVDVEQVQAITWAIAMSENKFGGGPACEAAAAQLRWTQRLLYASGTNEVRHDMYEAVANLSAVVAHTAFDIADYTAADRFFQFGLWAATEGKAWPLRANILSEIARKQIYLGEYEDALTSIEYAQVRSDRLAKTGQAMLWAVRARLLALNGRGEETAADVDRADECFAARTPAEDPPWLCYYDEAEHLGSTGKAMLIQARRTNRPEIAAGRLQSAIRLHGDAYPRSRTFSRIRLATLLMTSGDPVEAAAIGTTAVEEAKQISSRRIFEELAQLASVATKHAAHEEVATLRSAIASLA
ncbi:helix-turn-helix transcriptional regulator [Amycolatopsis sp. NPDC049868]|uniref:helix-turn-helix transcriptional regulator n=1 Tax=Amycolatopsis sp. NPDC049868 TaxID=3363934 RepID=UPI00378C90A4